MRKILISLLLICGSILTICAQWEVKNRTVLAIINATVIDATGSAARPDMTVIISGDRIVKIGKTQEIMVPQSVQVIDATGKFLIPGLWDMHVHLGDED